MRFDEIQNTEWIFVVREQGYYVCFKLQYISFPSSNLPTPFLVLCMRIYSLIPMQLRFVYFHMILPRPIFNQIITKYQLHWQEARHRLDQYAPGMRFFFKVSFLRILQTTGRTK